MSDELHSTIVDELLSLFEDAILAGALDEVILERAAILAASRNACCLGSQQKDPDRRSWN